VQVNRAAARVMPVNTAAAEQRVVLRVHPIVNLQAARRRASAMLATAKVVVAAPCRVQCALLIPTLKQDIRLVLHVLLKARLLAQRERFLVLAMQARTLCKTSFCASINSSDQTIVLI